MSIPKSVEQSLNHLPNRISLWWANRRNNIRIKQMADLIADETISNADRHSPVISADEQTKPVIFFNASARLSQFSQNAAFSLLTSWGLRLAGAPVIHFVCHEGLMPCVQGTNRTDLKIPPPCNACIGLSNHIYSKSNVRKLVFKPDQNLAEQIARLNINDLVNFIYPDTTGKILSIQDLQSSQPGDVIPLPGGAIPPGDVIPLGNLVLPAARWALRQHDLQDNSENRYLIRQYILSAFSLITQFNQLIEDTQPSAVVIFNGIMYPEACARWTALQHHIRCITHEVGFQPLSAFFSDGDATAYPINIPENFQMNEDQNKQLNNYLKGRFQGEFTMAGIRFWPEMRGLDKDFLVKTEGFSQIVPVFTNVVYDTSQVHANVVFDNMFAWLEMIVEIIREYPDTLFVIRAHPDEMRPGTAKQSRQSVHDWVYDNDLLSLPNVVFIDSLEYISSYELIQRSKFVMVYNSSIGLEAVLMGRPVVCGGKARYTQYPIVFFPPERESFRKQVIAFLESPEVALPELYLKNARRFLYYQLYRASIPFSEFLESGKKPGFVLLKEFDWSLLLPPTPLPELDSSSNNKTALDGKPVGLNIVIEEILNRSNTKSSGFLLPENNPP